MAMTSVQLGAALLLLAVLIFLARRREHMTAEDREGYRNIVLGIGLLNLVAAAFLAEATGAMLKIPFLSQSVFFNLTTAIASIAGVVLLAAGISVWLPISRAMRTCSRTRITRLELCRKIAQVVDVETETATILDKALAHIVNQVDLPGGAVFCAADNSTGEMSLLAVKKCDDAFSVDEAAIRVTLSSSTVHGSSDSQSVRVEVRDGASTPDMTLPVLVDGRPVAVFLLWSPSPGLDNDDRMLILLARDMVARAVGYLAMSARLDCRKHADEAARRLRVMFSSVGLPDAVVAAARLIQEVAPWELFSLTVRVGDHDIRRYTIGESGTLLTEKSLGRDALGARLTNQGTPMICGTRGLEVGGRLPDPVPGDGYSGAVVLELGDGSELAGRLVLATRRADLYRNSHLDALTGIRPELENALQAEATRADTDRRLSRAESIARLAALCGDLQTDIDMIFETAAQSLRRASGAAAVRISMYEDGGTFIRSRALSAVHPVENGVPAHGYMVSSIMPLHQGLRESGCQLLVEDGSASSPMTVAEAQQIYQKDLATALLQPIRAMGETVGVIAIVDRRGQERFRFEAGDLSFAASVASLLAVAWLLHETPWGALDHRDRIDSRSETRRREWGGRLRSSLSGILGSAEMLRNHPSGADLDRCLRIIDHSARRIEEYIREGEAAAQ